LRFVFIAFRDVDAATPDTPLRCRRRRFYADMLFAIAAAMLPRAFAPRFESLAMPCRCHFRQRALFHAAADAAATMSPCAATR